MKPTSIRFTDAQIAELQRTAQQNSRSISAEVVHRLFPPVVEATTFERKQLPADWDKKSTSERATWMRQNR